MKIAVQKFGGTSLANDESRKKVSEIIKFTLDNNYLVVVVVSAMGRQGEPYATDSIIDLVKEVNDSPLPRDMDLIMSCGEIISGIVMANYLTAQGIPTQFLTGGQAGIITDNNHNNAHIMYINPTKVVECLQKGVVPIIAGFQGVSENGDLTTLGRGGSDTSASAIGAALGAEIIDIFTDVEGIMTADPRIVKNAKLLDAVTYNEICQLAQEGAKVIHPRAVEIAMHSGIPLRVRSTFSDSPGTLVTHQIKDLQSPLKIIRDRLITGITYSSDLAQLKIKNEIMQDKAKAELKVFKLLAQYEISVDFINIQPELFIFTVRLEEATKALMVLQQIDVYPEIERQCAKVAVVGAAMTGIPGVMAKVVEALSENNIPILQSGDSYTNIWCLVHREHMEQAIKSLHDKFQLDK